MLQMDRTRSFAKVGDAVDIPNLVDIQAASYERFLQQDVPSDKRKPEGLEGLLREVFTQAMKEEEII